MQPVRFAEEEIDVEVSPGYVRVTGVYRFENSRPYPKVQVLEFPFPVDARHPAPDPFTASVTGAEERPMRSLGLWGKRYLVLYVPAKGERWLRAVYRQAAPNHDARYIVTTTQDWGRPLDRAQFRLHPNGVRITASNYTLTRDGQDSTAGFPAGRSPGALACAPSSPNKSRWANPLESRRYPGNLPQATDERTLGFEWRAFMPSTDWYFAWEVL
jgi:hypothetical protein